MAFDPTPVIKPFPPRAVDEEPGFSRLEPLVTPKELRETYLFGLPLRSVMTRQEMQDPAIQKFITRAVSRVEHEARIQVSPVKFADRHDYDLFDYQKWNFLQLNHWPILQVESFRGEYPFTSEFIEFPTDWIVTQNETGIIQLVPKNGTFSQFLITRDASLLPLILGGRMHWPQLWVVTYVAGFELDKIPAIINELVGTYATIEVLRTLNRVLFLGSHSIGIDGVSQSTTLPSPGWLAGDIKDLEEKAKELVDKVRRYYNHNIILSSIG